MKCFFGGPPRSGKSCLREGLKQALLRLIQEKGLDGFIYYPYWITGCPDGEGAWFQGTVNLSPEAAAEAKAFYKGKFTPAFVSRVATSVAACSEVLTLVDIGGFPSEENRAICAATTHAVLLAGDMSRLQEWRDFCTQLGVKVVAEIYSDYNGIEDKVERVDEHGILRGSVHHLERGESVHERPMIKALAAHLLHLVLESK